MQIAVRFGTAATAIWRDSLSKADDAEAAETAQESIKAPQYIPGDESRPVFGFSSIARVSPI